MPFTGARPGEPRPSARPPADPGRQDRRAREAAALAAAGVVAALVLLPAAVPAALILSLPGRLAGWRQRWLAVPLAAGAGWLAVTGPGRDIPALAAGAARRGAVLVRAAGDPSRLAHDPAAVLTAMTRLLPGELAGGLAAGAILAALIGRAAGAPGAARPAAMPWTALAAAAWRRRSAAVLAAGQTVTADGCAIGLDARTGRLAGLSWAAAERGILLTGSEGGTAAAAAAAACAALRRRKTVLAVGPGPAGSCAATAWLAGELGVEVSRVPAGGGTLAAAAGRAIRGRGVVVAAGSGGELLAGIAGVLAQLRALALRGDCLLWVSGARAADRDQIAALLELGPATGTAVLVSTASAAGGAALAGLAATTVACGPVRRELAAVLAGLGGDGVSAAALAGQQPGEFTVIGRDAVTPGCRAVPVTALAGRPGPSRSRLAAALPRRAGAPAPAAAR